MSSSYCETLVDDNGVISKDLVGAIEYNDKVIDEIRKICWPLFNLKEFNISMFEYGRIFKDGTLMYLSTHAEWHKTHLKNFAKSPFMLDHIKSVFNDKRECHIWDIQPINPLNKALNQFIDCSRKLGIINDFTIYLHDKNHLEFLSFSTDLKGYPNINLYINNAGFLKGFAEFFKEQATEILCELASRKISIAKEGFFEGETNDFLVQKKKDFLKKVRPKRYILETPKGPVKLTTRELQCFGYRCRGMIAKEIARKIINKKTNAPIGVGSVYLYFAKIAAKAHGQTSSQLRNIYLESNLINLPLEDL